VPLDRLLSACDLLTLHVPLAPSGPDPTFHLIDARASRGSARARCWSTRRAARWSTVRRWPPRWAQGRLGGALLDVWEGEPMPTPSWWPPVGSHAAHRRPLARRQGQRHPADLRRRLRALGAPARWSARACLPPPPISRLAIECHGLDDLSIVARALESF